MVLEVPLLGGVEGELQADEESLLVALEAVYGLGWERGIGFRCPRFGEHRLVVGFNLLGGGGEVCGPSE